MQNLHTLQAARLPLKLPTAPQVPILSTTTCPPTLYTVSRTDSCTFSLVSLPFPPNSLSSVSVPLKTLLPTSPSALTVFADNVLLALRSGELYNVDFSSRLTTIVGDVTHPDQARSGVLALSASPDSNLIAIISPHSLTLLDTAFSPVAELPHPQLASHAALSWRSDGEYLTYVIRTSPNSVQGFVVDRLCSTVAILDIDPDLSADLAVVVDWEPRVGGRITVSGPSSAVTFFERNGQRHRRTDFKIVSNGTPKLLSWSHDSRFLAVASEEREDQAEGDCFRVAFFCHSNYKWYCKKRYVFQHRVIALFWDQDDIGLITVLTEHDAFCFTLHPTPPTVSLSSSSAVAAVVNGPRVELTDFALALLPPPLCHSSFLCAEDVVSVSPHRDGNGICVLTNDGSLEWCSFNQDSWRIQRPGGSLSTSMCICHGKRRIVLDDDLNDISVCELRFSIMPSHGCAIVVALAKPWHERTTIKPHDVLLLFHLPSGEESWDDRCRLVMDGDVTAINHAYDNSAVIIAVNDGSLRRIVVDEISGGLLEASRVSGLSGKAMQIEEVSLRRGRAACFSLDTEGRLDVVEIAAARKMSVSKECTSFCIYEGFLVFTTRSHLLYCMALDSESSLANKMNRESIPSISDTLDAAEKTTQMPEGKGATRPIDRGSLIVTSLPGKTEIVLQAPRGNLEAIAPRPIVFEVVDRLAKRRDYGSAFELCRRQRVDMNHIVDADFHGFLENIAQFVAQVSHTSHLSVFLTLLKGETTRVNTVCDAVVRQLKQLPIAANFTTSIMTGLIRRDPPDIVSALGEVKAARLRSTDEAQSTIDFLFVLVKDESKVYAEALGTYDLDLAAFVAESSHMDPMEYSQELRALRATEENERKHKIDMKLHRYDSALNHLYLCGESRYEDCIKLCLSHALYETALPLFPSDTSRRAKLLEGYGRHLKGTGKFDAAAAVYLLNGNLRLACECYRLGSRWQLALHTVGRCNGVPIEEKRQMYTEIADELAVQGEMVECARIRVSMLEDLDGAVDAASSASEWDVAFEVVAIYAAQKESDYENRMAKGWKLVTECVLEGCESLVSTIQENRLKLQERGHRLRTLREATRKLRADMSAGGQGEDAESDAFSATSASSLGSNLSDVTFTSKASTTSLFATSSTTQINGLLSSARLEKQALRRQQRASKKRIREGHPKEMDYLPGYLQKLVPSDFLKDRVDKTVRALIAIGKSEMALSLLVDMNNLIEEALRLPDDVVCEERKSQLLNDRRWDEFRTTLSVVDLTPETV